MSEHTKGEEKTSFREAVVPNDVFGEFILYPATPKLARETLQFVIKLLPPILTWLDDRFSE